MRTSRALLACAAFGLLAAPRAQAQFTAAQVSGIQVNGSASFNGSNQLELTPASGGDGSAFFTTSIATAGLTTLNASFDYYIGGGTGADGLAFVLQGNGPGALGTGGGGIGYQGIGNSVGALFRSYVYNVAEVGVNGGFYNAASASIRGTHSATVAWTAASQNFTIVLDGTTTVTQGGIDLATLIGPQMYVGFTAATGGATDEHRIDDFSISTVDVNATPEPASMVLTATGLGLVAAFRRRVREA